MLKTFGQMQKNDYLCTIKIKITIKRIGDMSYETYWN